MMHATPTCHRWLRYGFIPRREQDLLESIRLPSLCVTLQTCSITWGILQLNNPLCPQSPLTSSAHTYGGEMQNTDQISFNHFYSLVFNSLNNEHCKNSHLRDRGNFKETETGCTKYLCEVIICFELTDTILCFWRKLLDNIHNYYQWMRNVYCIVEWLLYLVYI